MNESSGDIFIYPSITLMLYHNSAWESVTYQTGQEGEITSAERENIRSIRADMLPYDLESCSKIRIIEHIAIPMKNVFYVFHEITLE